MNGIVSLHYANQFLKTKTQLTRLHPRGRWPAGPRFETTSKSGDKEDGGNLLKRMGDARFSLFDSDYEIKSSEVVIFC